MNLKVVVVAQFTPENPGPSPVISIFKTLTDCADGVPGLCIKKLKIKVKDVLLVPRFLRYLLFFLEILNHYKNVRRITINLNFLFEDDKKDRLIEMLCLMHQNEPLKESIKVFSIEDAVISERNIESIFKSNIMQNI